jgi:hypothetical protein
METTPEIRVKMAAPTRKTMQRRWFSRRRNLR